MKTPAKHNRTITDADRAAAARLKAIWDERAESLGVTQQTMADMMDRSQGLVSQYLHGKIALNYRALIQFCKALRIADPREIRDDLPELAGPIAATIDRNHSSSHSPSTSQAVGFQREIVAAAVRLTAYVREVSIEDIPDDLYPEVLYEAMQVVTRVGVDAINDGNGMSVAAKEVAAAIRAR